MGCGTSTPARTTRLAMLNVEQGVELLDNFLKVDEEIWKEEQDPPVPTLGQSMVTLDKLNSELEVAVADVMKDKMNGLVPGAVPEEIEDEPRATSALMAIEKASASAQEQGDYESWDEAILKVIIELNINKKRDKALEHEEFIANLTRNALKHQKVLWLNRRKQEAEQEVSQNSERVQRVQALYEYQDNILSVVTGKPGPRTALEMDVERLKSYRDTLYSGLLAWVESARLAEEAAKLADKGAKAWRSLDESPASRGGGSAQYPEIRFRAATLARNAIQEATLCINAAQSALPGVQFTYCTSREITALYQVLEYLYTDMQIPERYQHGAKVYNSFQKRSVALFNWIKNMMQETIQKDVQDVDRKISRMANMLSTERANFIRQAAGLMLDNEHYYLPGNWRYPPDVYDWKVPNVLPRRYYQANYYNRGPIMY